MNNTKVKMNVNIKIFLVNIKTEDVYKDILNDVKKRFDVTNYD